MFETEKERVRKQVGTGQIRKQKPPNLLILTHTSVLEVVSQKSIPTRTRQLILYVSNRRG